MRLRELTAVSFRNYERLHFTPHSGCTILCGPNGQGKTNILEAICLLASGRSHRGAFDRELALWDGPGYRLEGEFEREGHIQHTVLVFDGRTKYAECEGVRQERLSNLLGRIAFSLFAPEDLSLVKGSPAERRRFLDMNLSQLSPAYLAALQAYQRALKQRNRAVGDWADGRAGRAEVELWDPVLVENGARVQYERAAYVTALAAEVHAVDAAIAPDHERLEVIYTPSVPAGDTLEELAGRFREELRRRQHRERRMRSTPCGPHRDDLRLSLQGRSLREFGSQGQHRSAVLALKLAEGVLLFQRSRTAPITLLDDFASELDEHRQAAILEMVGERGQVIITTTELTAPLAAVADKAVYRIERATLHEVPA